MNTIDIKAPAAMVRKFFLNPDIALRLNPSWQVKEIKATGKNLYALTLYDDRTEDSCQVILSVEVFEKSVNYGINCSRDRIFNRGNEAGTYKTLYSWEIFSEKKTFLTG